MAIKTLMVAILGSFALAATASAGQAQNARGIKIRSIAQAVSAPLRSFHSSPSTWQPGRAPRVIPWRKPLTPGAYKGGGTSAKGGKPGSGGGTTSGGGGGWTTDPDAKAPTNTVPSYKYQTATGATDVFQGQGLTGYIPPDTNLAVGENNGTTQIVQLVNTSYAVYNTSGTQLASGDLGLTLFANLPSSDNCSPSNPTSVTDGGDPIVLFDTFAGTGGRWIISQLAYNSNYTQFDYCLAVSNTSDATASYEVYDIPMGGDLPDYPKLAVWQDGIYLSANMFKLKVNRLTGTVSSTFLGAKACQFSLPAASTTNPPPTVSFNCTGGGNTAVYNILPADADGGNAPLGADGSDYYLQFVDNLSSTSGDELMLYQFQSTSQSGYQLVQLGPLNVATFHEACGGGTCIPQLGTSAQLDSLGDRLMYRLSYRNYGSGDQEMAVNQSVQLNSASNQTAIRWYKLTTVSANCASPSTGPFCVADEQTFDPPDANYRWMGSIALDSAGNLGLSYSESNSSSMDPSIAITGMESGVDATMEPETITWLGPNFQDTYSRWGDYSGMAVDPSDGCTFWYTNEYSTTTNVLGVWNFFWGTVIGSFHFPNCTSASMP